VIFQTSYIVNQDLMSIFQNKRVLKLHLEEIRLRTIPQALDVLALNEIRLDQTLTDSQITIDGYTVVRRDRSRPSGGVALYIRSTIDLLIRNDLSDKDLELFCIEVGKPKVKPFLVAAWYRLLTHLWSYLISLKSSSIKLNLKTLNLI